MDRQSRDTASMSPAVGPEGGAAAKLWDVGLRGAEERGAPAAPVASVAPTTPNGDVDTVCVDRNDRDTGVDCGRGLTVETIVIWYGMV